MVDGPVTFGLWVSEYRCTLRACSSTTGSTAAGSDGIATLSFDRGAAGSEGAVPGVTALHGMKGEGRSVKAGGECMEGLCPPLPLCGGYRQHDTKSMY